MLRVFGGGARDCDGVTRRSFLQAGVLGLGGLALPDLLRLRAAGAGGGRAAGRSVILFWLSGGPGHMETWDPKPDAAGEFRGPFGAIRTSVPGVQFGELLPEQARRMDKLAVLRTVNHGTGDHTKGNHWMLTGFEGPAFNAPDNTRPAPAVDGLGGGPAARRRAARACRRTSPCRTCAAGPTTSSTTRPTSAAAANPFVVESDPNDPKFRVRNLTLPGGLTLDRLEDRRRMLRGDRRPAPRRRPASCATSTPTTSAPSTCSPARRWPTPSTSPPSRPQLRDRYGRHTFGQSALLARRLVEAGVAVRHGQLRAVGPPRHRRRSSRPRRGPSSSSRRSTGPSRRWSTT